VKQFPVESEVAEQELLPCVLPVISKILTESDSKLWLVMLHPEEITKARKYESTKESRTEEDWENNHPRVGDISRFLAPITQYLR
jgi:hypothetical protein